MNGRKRKGPLLLILLLLAVLAAGILVLRSFRGAERPTLSMSGAFGYGSESEQEPGEEPETDLLGEALKSYAWMQSLSEEEYASAYGYPLAAPEPQPKGYELYDRILVDDQEGQLSVLRLWLDRGSGCVLYVQQVHLPVYEDKYEYTGGELFYNGQAGQGAGYLNSDASFSFALKGWAITAILRMHDGTDARYEAEQILRSVSLEGACAEDIWQEDSLAETDAALNGFQCSAQILRQKEDTGYWSAYNSQGLSQVSYGSAVRLRLQLLNESGQVRQQLSWPLYGDLDGAGIFAESLDLNADGAADLVLTLTLPGREGQAIGLVYDSAGRGLRAVKGLELVPLQNFDLRSGCYFKEVEGKLKTYDRYRVVEDNLTLTDRLTIDPGKDENERYCEYYVEGSRFLLVKENVGAAAIDWYKWPVVK